MIIVEDMKCADMALLFHPLQIKLPVLYFEDANVRDLSFFQNEKYIWFIDQGGQYPAILTKEAWSIKDLLYGINTTK